ncbi:FeoA family protein [Miniphocaeibacter massiliensis]|uniref:FeoA family protein n=1 Tax=Miniphocaeibacter massiliensis TaxID=2041841 RepID=UPI000C06C560|nr:FeoA family protein [Miniphocaeibacter massiliensis]
MILTIAPIGVPLKIIKIKGKDAQQKQLTNLGFVIDSEVSIVNEVQGNLIISVKGSRVAIGKELSNRIMVDTI